MDQVRQRIFHKRCYRYQGFLKLSLARLLEGRESYPLAQFISLSSFDDIVEAKKQQCVINIEEGNGNIYSVKTPSLSLKLGHSLKGCPALLRGVALRKRQKDLKETVDSFLELLEAEWSTKVSAAALRSLSDQQFNGTPILPFTGDLIKLQEFLTEKIPASTQGLLGRPTLQEWRSLAELTVARILIFNKRHGNEGSKILITQLTDQRRTQHLKSEGVWGVAPENFWLPRPSDAQK